jgi:hypothetical protein
VTNVFAVVGEHRERPDRLLLLGADGHYYTYVSAGGPPVEVEPGEEWEIDAGSQEKTLTPQPPLPQSGRGGARGLVRRLGMI